MPNETFNEIKRAAIAKDAVSLQQALQTASIDIRKIGDVHLTPGISRDKGIFENKSQVHAKICSALP